MSIFVIMCETEDWQYPVCYRESEQTANELAMILREKETDPTIDYEVREVGREMNPAEMPLSNMFDPAGTLAGAVGNQLYIVYCQSIHRRITKIYGGIHGMMRIEKMQEMKTRPEEEKMLWIREFLSSPPEPNMTVPAVLHAYVSEMGIEAVMAEIVKQKAIIEK